MSSQPKAGSGKGKVRVGLLGAGFIAEFHIRCIRSISTAELVAICDCDTAKVEAARERWQIPFACTDVNELLDRFELDIVHILLPPPAHAEHVLACLRAGCNVFVEKPVATSTSECEELKRAADESGALVGINHNARYHPALLRLVDEIKRYRLGQVQHVIACLNVPLRQLAVGLHSHWMFETPGNIILEQAPHPLSQIQLLLGPVREATSHHSGPTVLNTGVTFYDTWQVSLLCERGTAQCFLSFGKGFSESWLRVIGEDGSGFIDLRRNTLSLSEKTRFADAPDYLFDATANASRLLFHGTRNLANYALALAGVTSSNDPYLLGMRNSITAFYDAVIDRRPAPVDLEQGVNIIRTCEHIARSAAQPTR